jgi:hypothetical protein
MSEIVFLAPLFCMTLRGAEVGTVLEALPEGYIFLENV